MKPFRSASPFQYFLLEFFFCYLSAPLPAVAEHRVFWVEEKEEPLFFGHVGLFFLFSLWSCGLARLVVFQNQGFENQAGGERGSRQRQATCRPTGASNHHRLLKNSCQKRSATKVSVRSTPRCQMPSVGVRVRVSGSGVCSATFRWCCVQESERSCTPSLCTYVIKEDGRDDRRHTSADMRECHTDRAAPSLFSPERNPRLLAVADDARLRWCSVWVTLQYTTSRTISWPTRLSTWRTS